MQCVNFKFKCNPKRQISSFHLFWKKNNTNNYRQLTKCIHEQQNFQKTKQVQSLICCCCWFLSSSLLLTYILFFSWKSKTVIKIICHFKLYTYIHRILKKKNKKIAVVIKQTISWCKTQFEKIYDTSLNKWTWLSIFFHELSQEKYVIFFSFPLKELTFKITELKLRFKKKHKKSGPQSH